MKLKSNDWKHFIKEGPLNVHLIKCCRFLDEILENSMTLLAAHQTPSVSASSHMTPVHFLALIDPIASWFTKWMVSGALICDKTVLNKIKSTHKIYKTLVAHV